MLGLAQRCMVHRSARTVQLVGPRLAGRRPQRPPQRARGGGGCGGRRAGRDRAQQPLDVAFEDRPLARLVKVAQPDRRARRARWRSSSKLLDRARGGRPRTRHAPGSRGRGDSSAGPRAASTRDVGQERDAAERVVRPRVPRHQHRVMRGRRREDAGHVRAWPATAASASSSKLGTWRFGQCGCRCTSMVTGTPGSASGHRWCSSRYCAGSSSSTKPARPALRLEAPGRPRRADPGPSMAAGAGSASAPPPPGPSSR